jgi:hypothetical protein
MCYAVPTGKQLRVTRPTWPNIPAGMNIHPALCPLIVFTCLYDSQEETTAISPENGHRLALVTKKHLFREVGTTPLVLCIRKSRVLNSTTNSFPNACRTVPNTVTVRTLWAGRPRLQWLTLHFEFWSTYKSGIVPQHVPITHFSPQLARQGTFEFISIAFRGDC